MGTQITPTPRPAPNPRNCAHYHDEPSGDVEVVCANCYAERGRQTSAPFPRKQSRTGEKQ